MAICPTLGWGKDFFDSQSMIDPVFNGTNIVAVGQRRTPRRRTTRSSTRRWTAPRSSPTQPQRANAWANLDKEITGQVYVIPWLWDNEVGFDSKNVNGVQWTFNGGDWDLDRELAEVRERARS